MRRALFRDSGAGPADDCCADKKALVGGSAAVQGTAARLSSAIRSVARQWSLFGIALEASPATGTAAPAEKSSHAPADKRATDTSSSGSRKNPVAEPQQPAQRRGILQRLDAGLEMSTDSISLSKVHFSYIIQFAPHLLQQNRGEHAPALRSS